MSPLAAIKLLEQEVVYPAESTTPTKIKKPSCPMGIPQIDALLPHSGLPFGAIHEAFSIFDTPPLSLFTQIAASSILTKPILWIGDQMIPTPQFLAQYSSNLLNQSVFIKPRSKRDLLWTIDEASQCRGIWGIYAQLPSVKLSFLRKLSLMVKDSGIFLFLFRYQKDKAETSNALSRWEITPSVKSAFEISLLRYKGVFHEPKSWHCNLSF